jgi:hypothetical protein
MHKGTTKGHRGPLPAAAVLRMAERTAMALDYR